MPCVYILRGSSGRHYIGSTVNFEQRLIDHRKGNTATTKRLGSKLVLVISKEVSNLAEARKLEKFLKAKKNPQLAIWHLQNC